MKYCLLGRHGFIGSALEKKLLAEGHTVTSNPTKDVDVVVHLASPTHLTFDQNPAYHLGEALSSFQLLLPFCKENDILFVYASSALVYEPEKKSPMRNCKLILEQLAEAYGGRTLGLRIFPVYGPGDTTAISQWCHAMREGSEPIVYGDGSQERDFIYIDDVVDSIISLIEEGKEGIVDVGGGKPYSFNEIVATINTLLGTDLEPVYVGSPGGYSKGAVPRQPLQTKVSLEDGLKNILAK